MKRICICIVAAAAALCAADQPAPKQKGAAARSTAPAKPAPKQVPTLTVPAGAVQTGPETWRYNAADGRTWTYRKTPFGVVRYEDKEQQAAAAPLAGEKEIASIKAVEDGDNVRFERPGPFGAYKWTRKKSELNDVERQALERSHAGADPSARK